MTMRLSGLASGMDTDSMVKQLMRAEQIKVDRVKQDKQILEWRKEIYNSLNKDFANFILKSKETFGYNNLGRPGSMNWVKSAVSSNESVATVTTRNGALEGNHSITVNKLADGVKGGSNKEIEKDTKFDAMTFSINGKEVSIAQDSNINDVVKAINDTEDIGVRASYDSATKRFFIQSNGTGKESGEIKLSTTDAKAQTFINDTLDLQLSHYDTDGNLELTNVNLTDDGTELSFSGVDANITYNGLELKQSSNNFQLNGMNINIQSTGSFNVNVSTDADAIVDKVKSFVEEYNQILEKASTLMNEKVNRNYKPLTDEEREAMSDKEIELWETRAKSGIIRRDMDVENMLSSMRLDMYKDVEGVTGSFKNITELGITTQGYKAGAVGGKLEINEDKLRKAIAKDPEAVLEVLFKEDSTNATRDDSRLSAAEIKAKRENSGIVTRIFDNMLVGMKGLIAKSGPGGESELFRRVRSTMLSDFTTSGGRFSGKGSISDIDDELSKFDKRIDDLNAYLFRKENSYYARFTAMEKAMQRASSQSGWLMQQFGG